MSEGEFNDISVIINVTWDRKLCCSHVSESLEEIDPRRSFKTFLLAIQQFLIRANLGNNLLEAKGLQFPSPRLCVYIPQRSSGNNVLTQSDVLQNTFLNYANRYAWKKHLWFKKFSEFWNLYLLLSNLKCIPIVKVLKSPAIKENYSTLYNPDFSQCFLFLSILILNPMKHVPENTSL